MNLLTPVIEEKVQSSIIGSMGRKAYHQASRQISEILVELHANIPDKKRVSYGIVYTIKVLGEYLYTELVRTGAPIREVAGVLFEEGDGSKPKCVALAIMSFHGLGDLETTLGYFEIVSAWTGLCQRAKTRRMRSADMGVQ